jgi:hypothetical protein
VTERLLAVEVAEWLSVGVSWFRESTRSGAMVPGYGAEYKIRFQAPRMRLY